MYFGERRHLGATGILPGIALVCVLGSSIAIAGDWTLTDSQTLSVTAVDRSGDDAYSGNVFQFSPQFRLNGRGGRSFADVNYRLTMSYGTGSTDPRPFAHNLLARGEVEAVENFFFLGATAGARLSGGTGGGSTPVDAINFNADGGSQSFSLRVTPKFRAHLNRYADLVSNNSVDVVKYTKDSNSGSGDSKSMTLNIGVRNGRYFGPMNWSVNLTHRRTGYTSRDDTNTDLIASAGYRIDSNWLVRGSLGYEVNDVETTRSDTDGVTWNVGAVWTPSGRTTLSADYGQRYYGQTISARVQHRTKRTRTSFDVYRGVENRRTTELVDSYFYLVDSNGQVVVDPDTGDPIIANIPELQQTDEDYVTTRLRGIVTVTGVRTNVTLTGTVENRDYEVSPISEDSYDVSLDISRRLGPNFRARLGGDIYHSERNNGYDSDTYDLRFSLTRQFSARTSVSLDLLHRDRNTSSEGGDYTENRVGISLISSFL